MSVTDPIADMATLIRNGSSAGKEKVDIKASKVNEEVLKILKKERFIENYKKIDDNKQGLLRVYLKYGDAYSHKGGDASHYANILQEKRPHTPNRRGRPSIINIKRVSRPGLRVYKNKDEIKPVLGGLGISIISTSQGIMTGKESCEKGLGGEVMLEVW